MVFLIQFVLTFVPSRFRIFILNLMGHEISRKAYISPLAVVVSPKIKMGAYSRIRPFSALKCGTSVEMSPYSEVSNFVLVHGGASLTVGLRSVIGLMTLIDVHKDVELGEYSATGVKNVLMTHGLFWPVPWGYKAKFEPIRIGNMVWITSNVKIFAGAQIDDEVLVMPNATISGHVKKSSGVYANPLDTKNMPIAFFKSPLNINVHREFVKEVVTEFTKDRGYTFDEHIDPAKVSRHIICDYKILKSGKLKYKMTFYCGLPSNFSKESADFCYDLQKLVYSSKMNDKDTQRILDIMRSQYGIRSMEVSYVDLVKTFNTKISPDNKKYVQDQSV